MVRRTKEQAEATRDSILDAGERLIEKQGLSSTTLQDIALAAGVTRGAVYWHFKNKRDLFDSIIERAFMPLESTLLIFDSRSPVPPLDRLRLHANNVLVSVLNDDRLRRLLDLIAHKIEYVDEIMAVRDRILLMRARHIVLIKQYLLLAELPESVCQTQAIGLHVVLDGLIQNWLLDTTAFNLQEDGRMIVDVYLNGLSGLRTDRQAVHSSNH